MLSMTDCMKVWEALRSAVRRAISRVAQWAKSQESSAPSRSPRVTSRARRPTSGGKPSLIDCSLSSRCSLAPTPGMGVEVS